MVTRIAIENYRQIAKGQSIDLVRAADDGEVLEPSRAAGIWGANGAGKSAVVDGLEWLREAAVGWPIRKWPPTPRVASARPTTLGIDIVLGTDAYCYTVSTNDERITAERLDVASNGGDPEMAFERKGNRGIKIGTRLRDGFDKADPLEQIDRYGTVLLEGRLISEPLCSAVSREIERIAFARPFGRTREAARATARTCAADGPPDSPAGLRRRIAAALLQLAGVRMPDCERDRCTYALERIEDAGEGGRRMAAIAGPAAEALASGGLLVVDPIDCGLHTLVQKRLIECFTRQPRERSDCPQFLFTTSSTELLDTMERHQVWFAQQKLHGTALWNLTEFRDTAEEKQKTRQRYEAGRYGAVPDADEVSLQRACNAAAAAAATGTDAPESPRPA